MPGEDSACELTLRIGNETVRICSDHRSFIHQTRSQYANFAAGPVHSCMTIHVDVFAGGSEQSALLDMDCPDVR